MISHLQYTMQAKCRSKNPYLLGLKHHRTPIHNYIRPINIPPRITHQRDKRPRQFPRMPHPPHRIPTIPAIPRPLQPRPIVQDSIHIPRAQTIDSNTIATPLSSQALGKTQQRRLRAIVRCLRLREIRVVRADTRRERDAAGRTLFLYLPRDSLCAEKAACEVDVVCASPLVGGHLDGVRAAHDAREAAQHVDAAQHLRGAFYGRGYLGFVAHVDGFGHDAPVGEACVQLLDAVEGGVGVYVPKCEA